MFIALRNEEILYRNEAINMLLLRSKKSRLTKDNRACYYQFPEFRAPLWLARSIDFKPHVHRSKSKRKWSINRKRYGATQNAAGGAFV